MPLIQLPPYQQFPQLFRGWHRIEARSRRDDFAHGLSASTADGLWFLARQWQMRELQGENAASPIRTDVTYDVASLDEVKLGSRPFAAIGSTPVEVLVEREAVAWDWRLRVRAGQHFERLARAHPAYPQALIDELRGVCPVAPPPIGSEEWIDLDYASRRFIALMQGRAINGEALFELIRKRDPRVPASLADRMLQWYSSLYSQDEEPAPPAWRAERLDYEFHLRAGDPTSTGSLHARSYRNGSVDWSSFVSNQSPAAGFHGRPKLHLTPAHVTYAGQPTRRWWEFEDRAVDFGALDTAKTDLGKLILAEFAISQGDDWFVVPLNASPNSLVRVLNVEVVDCFGVRTAVARADDAAADPLQRWEAYVLSPGVQGGGAEGVLYVPPAAGAREESPVLEEVQFARDEDANAVWAIEHIVPNQLGEPSRGFASHLEAQRRWRNYLDTQQAGPPATAPAPASAENATPRPIVRYVLATKVPQNWIPFLATDARNLVGGMPQRSVKLRRAEIVSTEAADALRPISALSRLLSPRDGEGVELINEEAVGRAGVRIELRRQRVRSATGKTFVWLGRKVGVDEGLEKSSLQFDVLRDREGG